MQNCLFRKGTGLLCCLCLGVKYTWPQRIIEITLIKFNVRTIIYSWYLFLGRLTFNGIKSGEFIMTLTDRIELNPRVCNGRPVIKGTRIPVSVILEQIAEGESWDTLLVGYPELKKEDIQAALLYAKTSLDHTEIRAAYA